MSISRSNRNALSIAGIAALFFFPFLGGVHLFDWDEINFAEIAREMVVLGDYLKPHMQFVPFTEKPPLFFWLQALSMEVFGVGEYAARFPNALCGIATLVALYKIGEKLHSERFGWLWAGAYFGAILSNLYFKSGIIDPWFNLFIFLGLYHLILFYWKKSGMEGIKLRSSKWPYLVWAGIFTGLGMLTKGPVAYLITGGVLAVYWVHKRFRFYIQAHEFALYTLIALAVTSLWYGAITFVHGTQFVVEFTIRQWELFSRPDAGHAGFPGYHFVVILFGCFPASIFLIRAHGKLELSESHTIDFRRWMLMLFWVVIILFSITASKIVHYSSMTYFAIAYLTALVAEQLITGKIQLAGWMKGMLWGIGGLAGTLVAVLPFAAMNIEVLKPLFEKDKFALKNLDALVNWTGIEAISGLLLIGTIATFIWFAKRERMEHAFRYLFGGVGVFVFVTLVLFIAKIESYSQRAAIEFYESKQGCDCYVANERYKSYGPMFYARMEPGYNPASLEKEWLKHGDIDKDAFFVAKVTGTKELDTIPDVELLYEKNGFTFWKRSAQ